MANGKLIFGKQSGGSLSLVIPDGVSDTEVIVPESGELATKEYVDNRDSIQVNGAAVFDGSTQNINMAGVGNITLEIGDVIEVSGTTGNDKLFTVESIVNNNNIVVNYEHRGTSTPAPIKRLVSETVEDCTIKLYNRAKNAPLGQGQGWCDVTSQREESTDYTNNTNRVISVSITTESTVSTETSLSVDGFVVGSGIGGTISSTVPNKSIYSADGLNIGSTIFYELR